MDDRGMDDMATRMIHTKHSASEMGSNSYECNISPPSRSVVQAILGTEEKDQLTIQ